MPTGLYVHLPFCLRKCAYCDFNSIAAEQSLMDAYLPALVRELGRYRGLAADTVYVGGGTPTIYSDELLAGLLQNIVATLDVSSSAEVTVEANPGTLCSRAFDVLRSAGYNRLSLGVQSFDDGELALLGRIHSARQAREAFWAAREGGFANISIDLMRGLPGQSLAAWQRTVEAGLELRPEHISIYGLTLEEGTPLARRVRQGELPHPDGADDPSWVRWTVDRLGQAGYDRYEVSNYCRDGLVSRHNLNYWRNGEYLGVGAGAWSYMEGRRYRNVADPAEYVSRVTDGKDLVTESETLGLEASLGETLMLGLRLVEGVDMEELRDRFGVDMRGRHGTVIERFVQAGLMRDDGHRLALTFEGLLVQSRVAMEFLA